jgi:hypothetical protein
MSGSNTIRLSKHLLKKHQIRSEKEAETGEDREIAQASPIATSFLQ